MRTTVAYVVAAIALTLLSLGVLNLAPGGNPFDSFARFVLLTGLAYLLWNVSLRVHPAVSAGVLNAHRRAHGVIAWALLAGAMICSFGYLYSREASLDPDDHIGMNSAALTARIGKNYGGKRIYVAYVRSDPSPDELAVLSQHTGAVKILPWSARPDSDACPTPARTFYLFACDELGYELWFDDPHFLFWRVGLVRWGQSDCSGEVLVVKGPGRWRSVAIWTNICFTPTEMISDSD